MLLALELNGFKSFADRTRFDFPAGTTVVVGPNGSGKSNVVDAVKWVLGAQSVKSLRGSEMTDVIFSGSKSRRQAGAAEATLVFDNRSKTLDLEEDEVQVSRRVFRSGESEYLINRRPCRLRDIQDLLAKIGVSTGSYTIIEQGKVDALLQASAQERRTIFEEAAGVSRFRAKRREAERRLERIEQNLLRLSDIVDEVESRLKIVRTQAGKAKRFKELRDRLKALQLNVAIHEWRCLQSQKQSLATKLASESKQLQSLQRRRDDFERSAQEAESTVLQLQQQIRRMTADDAVVRERIAACESKRGSHLDRLDELEQESERQSRHSLSSDCKLSELCRQLDQVDSQLRASVEEHRRLEHDASQRTVEFDDCDRQLTACEELGSATETELKQRQGDLVQLQSKLAKCSSVLDSSERFHEQRRRQLEPIRQSCDRLATEAEALESLLHSTNAALNAATTEVETLRTRMSHNRSQLQRTQSLLAETQGQLSGAKERMAVLSEMEHRLGGLHAGAKEVLRRASEEQDGPFSSVRGVVADLFHVDADTAPLIEIALGERTSHIVLDDTTSLTDCLEDLAGQWRNRTSFLRLDVPAPASAIDRVELSAEHGVMGRADQFVETAPEFKPLAKRLLGRIWLVDAIATALRLAEGPGRGLGFVTLAGELITGDGVLSVGPHQAHRGLLSRRTELTDLSNLVAELEQRCAEMQREAAKTELQIADDERTSEAANARFDQCTRANSDASLRAASAIEKHKEARRQLQSLQRQLEESAASATIAKESLEECREKIAVNRKTQSALESTLVESAMQRRELEGRIHDLRQSNTDARIELARCEQLRTSLKSKLQQLDGDVHDHRLQHEESSRRLQTCRQRRTELACAALELSVELAELYCSKDRFAEELIEMDLQLELIQEQRVAASQSAAKLRDAVGRGQQEKQALDVESLQLQQRTDSISQRMASEYGVELHDAASDASDELDFDPAAATSEIGQLQAQLSTGGSVNLEALHELQELEQRHSTLASQLEDMKAARTQLQQISQRMNARCAALYIETVNNVRIHFQEVFRALFGGGDADILVEPIEDASPLEAGVSIMARPPGKQPRSISLLSGGEKTLTCVALLLAIFRNRPSPFCVLDEVDAALDETNIDRFLTALGQFMGSTQFIVVTHSKRTMTCADTLYGVTMQESGVSKRVSVRFEDVGVNGEIRVAKKNGSAPQVANTASRAA